MDSKRAKLDPSCKKAEEDNKDMTESLNNLDVLRHIFSYLDFDDMVTAAKSCKIFSDAFNLRLIKNFKFKLDAKYRKVCFGSSMQSQYNYHKLEIMEYVFSHFGYAIQSIDCNGMRQSTKSDITTPIKCLELIAKYATNLESFKLLWQFPPMHLEILSEKFRCLEKLDLEINCPLENYDIQPVFPNILPNLKKLHLHYNRANIVDLVCNAIAAPNLESLFLMNFSLLKFREFCGQCPALKHIILEDCKLNEKSIAFPHSGELANLQSIRLLLMVDSDFDLSCLGHLENLTEVHLLACPPLCVDSFLAKICERDQLRTLNLQIDKTNGKYKRDSETGVSDDTLKLLSQMRNLANFVLINHECLIKSEKLCLLWNNNFSLMIISRIDCTKQSFEDFIKLSPNLKKVQLLIRFGPFRDTFENLFDRTPHNNANHNLNDELSRDLWNPTIKDVPLRNSGLARNVTVFSNIDADDESVKNIHFALESTKWRICEESVDN